MAPLLLLRRASQHARSSFATLSLPFPAIRHPAPLLNNSFSSFSSASSSSSSSSSAPVRATLFPGDGIGPEIAAAVREVFRAAKVPIEWEEHYVGEEVDPRTGSFLTYESMESVRRNGIGLKGPMTTPIGKGHKSLNLTLRKELGLYANVRPCLSIPGYKTRYDNVNLVTIRENTEGEYSGLEHQVVRGVVESLKIITRQASLRVAEYAFHYAKTNGRQRVSAIHKANIMKKTDGLFLQACEIIRTTFDRKCEQLKFQDAKGEDLKTIDKTRATVKSLDTQLMVAIKAIHSISSSIQKVTNDELYPQLVEILAGLIDMWNIMWDCHRTQAEIALEMKSLESSFAVEEVVESQSKATNNLENELNSWQTHFSHWIISQRYYIDSLVAWLRLCDIEPETDKKGRIVSPCWAGGPPIFSLTKKWQQALKQLEEKQKVVDAVADFSIVLHSLQLNQMEELHQKRRADILAKDLDRRTLFLQAMEEKNVALEIVTEEKELAGVESEALHEGRLALDNIRSGVEEEQQKLGDTMHGRQEVTLASFKVNLPMIFQAMALFAADAFKEYEKVQCKLDIRKI